MSLRQAQGDSRCQAGPVEATFYLIYFTLLPQAKENTSINSVRHFAKLK
jgi:hypothetical protein